MSQLGLASDALTVYISDKKIRDRALEVLQSGSLTKVSPLDATGKVIAVCRGSRNEEYNLMVQIGEDGYVVPDASTCSCPYFVGRPCKHLAALLLQIPSMNSRPATAKATIKAKRQTRVASSSSSITETTDAPSVEVAPPVAPVAIAANASSASGRRVLPSFLSGKPEVARPVTKRAAPEPVDSMADSISTVAPAAKRRATARVSSRSRRKTTVVAEDEQSEESMEESEEESGADDADFQDLVGQNAGSVKIDDIVGRIASKGVRTSSKRVLSDASEAEVPVAKKGTDAGNGRTSRSRAAAAGSLDSRNPPAKPVNSSSRPKGRVLVEDSDAEEDASTARLSALIGISSPSRADPPTIRPQPLKETPEKVSKQPSPVRTKITADALLQASLAPAGPVVQTKPTPVFTAAAVDPLASSTSAAPAAVKMTAQSFVEASLTAANLLPSSVAPPLPRTIPTAHVSPSSAVDQQILDILLPSSSKQPVTKQVIDAPSASRGVAPRSSSSVDSDILSILLPSTAPSVQAQRRADGAANAPAVSGTSGSVAADVDKQIMDVFFGSAQTHTAAPLAVIIPPLSVVPASVEGSSLSQTSPAVGSQSDAPSSPLLDSRGRHFDHRNSQSQQLPVISGPDILDVLRHSGSLSHEDSFALRTHAHAGQPHVGSASSEPPVDSVLSKLGLAPQIAAAGRKLTLQELFGDLRKR